jgi:hypothetical protein
MKRKRTGAHTLDGVYNNQYFGDVQVLDKVEKFLCDRFKQPYSLRLKILLQLPKEVRTVVVATTTTPTLLLSGHPGSGKSTAIRHVIEKLHNIHVVALDACDFSSAKKCISMFDTNIFGGNVLQCVNRVIIIDHIDEVVIPEVQCALLTILARMVGAIPTKRQTCRSVVPRVGHAVIFLSGQHDWHPWLNQLTRNVLVSIGSSVVSLPTITHIKLRNVCPSHICSLLRKIFKAEPDRFKSLATKNDKDLIDTLCISDCNMRQVLSALVQYEDCSLSRKSDPVFGDGNFEIIRNLLTPMTNKTAYIEEVREKHGNVLLLDSFISRTLRSSLSNDVTDMADMDSFCDGVSLLDTLQYSVPGTVQDTLTNMALDRVSKVHSRFHRLVIPKKELSFSSHSQDFIRETTRNRFSVDLYLAVNIVQARLNHRESVCAVDCLAHPAITSSVHDDDRQQLASKLLALTVRN